jgi:AraC-like DNA-binding protein
MKQQDRDLAARRPGFRMITVQRMVDLIERGYAERITVKTLGAALRGRAVQLGRLFQAHLGVSVHEYLTQVRLDHAAHLIRSRMKVEAVSLSVGYRSKKNFYRQFMLHFGVTPETYRQRAGAHQQRRSPPARGDQDNGWTNIATYAATFNHTACRIKVESRPNLKGSQSYVATPYVVVDEGVQPFATVGDRIEIAAETEADAIERAARFLEHRFGPRLVAPKRQHDQTRYQTIRPPRP